MLVLGQRAPVLIDVQTDDRQASAQHASNDARVVRVLDILDIEGVLRVRLGNVKLRSASAIRAGAGPRGDVRYVRIWVVQHNKRIRILFGAEDDAAGFLQECHGLGKLRGGSPDAGENLQRARQATNALCGIAA